MSDIPLLILAGALIVLIALSAFFSGSEIGLMTLNRYRLRHLCKAKHAGAMRASQLLEKPDRLIGLILLWSNFLNALATGLATVIALKLFGDSGIAVATGVMTLLLLIFTDIAPKTLAALHPERIAFPAAFALTPLLWLSRPLVHVANILANGLLKLLGISTGRQAEHSLSSEELRTVVIEAGAMIPRRHQKMLLSILDLEKVTVEDIMVPRNEIVGIDLDDDWETITQQITQSQHTRLPVYREHIDQVVGFVHLRHVLKPVIRGDFDRDALRRALREPYFIPEGTPLNKQLINFQREQRRIGLTVDEYGDILGLVTFEDILEEIVGQFTTDPAATGKDIQRLDDGSFLVDGGATLREINRALDWKLPTTGPKTLNGLLLEYLETIPTTGISVLLAEHPVEIVKVEDNAIKTARIYPARRSVTTTEDAV